MVSLLHSLEMPHVLVEGSNRLRNPLLGTLPISVSAVPPPRMACRAGNTGSGNELQVYLSFPAMRRDQGPSLVGRHHASITSLHGGERWENTEWN